MYSKLLPLGILLGTAVHAEGWLGYALSQGLFQGSLLLKARPVEEVLLQESLDPQTEKYLRLSQMVLRYAESELQMKTGQNYRRFVRLEGDSLTWVVSAAQRERLETHLFKFPVVGALPYKGFFREDDARAEAQRLEAEGFDVSLRGVDAFSSLGWMPDPIFSTMFSSQARFVETLFHELTHLNFFFDGQVDFNEAFATWFGTKAALAFIEKNSYLFDKPQLSVKGLVAEQKFHVKFASFLKKVQSRGQEIYAQPGELESRRQTYFQWIRNEAQRDVDLKRLAEAKWNNAFILSLGTYYDLIPQIDAVALAEKLSPKEFLAKIVKEGPTYVRPLLEAAAKNRSDKP